jgi:transposase-like protein
VFTSILSFPDEKECAYILRILRWSKSCSVVCPYCYSSNIKKDGHYRYYQKYKCKSCTRWLNDKTGTIFHYSHTSLRKWFLVLYLFFILWPGCSIREISIQLGVSYRKCYYFIRTVIDRLTKKDKEEEEKKSWSSSSFTSINNRLKGTIEVDELYVKAGMKGRSYPDKILNDIRRLPRKRGLKPWRGRGTFDKDQPMILCIHQRRRITRRNKKFSYFDVPIQRSIINIIAKTADSSSTVYTDEYPIYEKLEESKIVYHHKTVSHSDKEYARGRVHVNNCECMSNLFQIWIRKFMGINKYTIYKHMSKHSSLSII